MGYGRSKEEASKPEGRGPVTVSWKSHMGAKSLQDELTEERKEDIPSP